ncbi:MAG: 3'-5' exonuclease, partial [Symbiobacteriaceae bacterium]|nr:3'-5' exonuclease [Symbiobacteriaceae bacterium]
DGFVVIDVETTGLNSDEHVIIEIGALKVVNGEVADSFQSLIKVPDRIPASITSLTGISDDMINAQGRPIDVVVGEFLSFVGDFPLVAHNIRFDIDFLNAACNRLGLKAITNRCIDTLSLSRRLIPGLPNYKLESLTEHLSIEAEESHRGFSDCIAVSELYLKLMKMMDPDSESQTT